MYYDTVSVNFEIDRIAISYFKDHMHIKNCNTMIMLASCARHVDIENLDTIDKIKVFIQDYNMLR